MTVRVRPLECGWLTSDAAGMVTGQSGRMRMPVPAFLVETPSASSSDAFVVNPAR